MTNVTPDVAAAAAAPQKSRPGPRGRGPAVNWMLPLWIVGGLSLLVLVLIPVGYMLVASFIDTGTGAFSLATYADLVTNPFRREAMINSLVVALSVGVGSVILAVPLAFGVARTGMRGKKVVQASVIVSIISPDFLVAMAYIILLGPNAGYINRIVRDLFGLDAASGPFDIFTVWGFVFIALPRGVAFVFLTLVPAFQNSDPALEEAARIGGAGPLRTFMSVTLPVLRPALISGLLITFALTIAMFGTPYMLNVNVLPIAIRQSLVLNFDFQIAATLSMVLTVMCIVALAIYQASTRREARFRTVGGKSFGQRDMRLGAYRHVLTGFAMLYALIAFVLPYGTLLAVSFMRSVGQGFRLDNFTLGNYTSALGSANVLSGLLNSFVLAFATATILTVVTPLLAYLVVRGRGRARRAFDYLSILPMGIPGTAVATALIIAYLNPPLSTLALYGTLGILLLAYLTNSLPFGVRMSQSTLVQFSPELEEASRVSGASQFMTIARITLPMMRSTLLYVWMLVFILTYPEMSSSVLLAGVRSQVAATVILDLWAGSGGLTQASAVSVLMFIGVVAMLGIAQVGVLRSRVRVKTNLR